jgi:rod shape determining protein RodA
LFLIVSSLDVSFLKQSRIILILYAIGISMLLALIFVGATNKGATSWFNFGGFSFQPSDLMKLALILVLAKYLARRHVEIRAIRHIIITGMYFVIPFLLIFIQPDFGSAIILFGIWFGMILVSGISRKHLLILFISGLALFMIMWTFALRDYQKDRLRTFIDPLSDIQGAGYNAYQSTIAVGSGQLMGKGVGYGTQSRLNFLPEYETDFIYAAVAEEWGFIGSVIVLLLYGIVQLLFLLFLQQIYVDQNLIYLLIAQKAYLLII